MAIDDLTPEQRNRLWRLARQRLQLHRSRPPVSAELADRLRDYLSAGSGQPTDRLRRALDLGQKQADVRSFVPRSSRVFTPLSEFVRLAADSGDEELPLPAEALESTDGQFRLSVRRVEAGLELHVEALGFAVDRLASKTLGLADADDAMSVLVTVTLDAEGDGIACADDTPQLRRALLRPLLVLIEND